MNVWWKLQSEAEETITVNMIKKESFGIMMIFRRVIFLSTIIRVGAGYFLSLFLKNKCLL